MVICNLAQTVTASFSLSVCIDCVCVCVYTERERENAAALCQARATVFALPYLIITRDLIYYHSSLVHYAMCPLG
jgi:hypothetical protein